MLFLGFNDHYLCFIDIYKHFKVRIDFFETFKLLIKIKGASYEKDNIFS
jgi:hypothetical protein